MEKQAADWESGQWLLIICPVFTYWKPPPFRRAYRCLTARNVIPTIHVERRQPDGVVGWQH